MCLILTSWHPLYITVIHTTTSAYMLSLQSYYHLQAPMPIPALAWHMWAYHSSRRAHGISWILRQQASRQGLRAMQSNWMAANEKAPPGIQQEEEANTTAESIEIGRNRLNSIFMGTSMLLRQVWHMASCFWLRIIFSELAASSEYFRCVPHALLLLLFSS